MTDAPLSLADFEPFLRDISLCFPSRDFDAWATHVALPFTMHTINGVIEIRERGGLEANFNRYLDAMDMMGVDLILRTPLALDDSPAGTRLTYRTELLSNGRHTAAPFVSTAALERGDDGTWRMRAIENALGHHIWTGLHPETERGMQ